MNALRHSKNWLSIVLILAILGHFGLGHRDASAFVLCFGEDGHVAVEHVGYDHGIGPDKNDHFSDAAGVHFTGGDTPCNAPCTDISLDGDDHIPLSLTDFVKIALDSGLLPIFFLFSLLALHGRSFIRQPVFFDPPFTDPRLLALRSIVLLI
ncbi:MAG: hypothetical protein KGZ80_00180 [Methylomonas sp.]|nr:hypothetical protein [Methylomonas sp.]